MINVKAQFLEPEVNREASNYVKENYNAILRQLPKLGVSEEVAVDLLNDVYISLLEAEDEGKGYDINKSNQGDCILVEQFVYGRLKRYSLNSRYRTDVVERRVNKDNQVKVEVRASTSGATDDYDSLDTFQRAYATAGAFDDIETLEDELSLAERIDYCIEFDHVVGMSMLALFRNIDVLSSDSICKSLFNPLKEALQIHDEFAEAFKGVLEYSITNRNSFETVLATF